MADKRQRHRGIGLMFVLLGSLLLSACTSESLFNWGSSDDVVKSPNDDRQYRYIELDNGLKALLVSDPSTDKAAAALDVEVGSAQDPKDREGLAHFLEHMLFLGTDKYPQPEAYQAFISAHGGSHNAYTAFEDTNYFFDVEPDYLEGALDRFSRFFVAPLFTEAYVEREKNAVYSEYQAKLTNEFRRSYDVFKQQVNPQNPMAKFSVGNLQTLGDRDGDPVRSDLLAFYKRYYSANIMTLAVLGQENLDDLEAMVRAKFSAIPSTKVASNAISEPLFTPGKLPGLLHIKTLKDIRKLSFSFPIPSQRQWYHAKPELFIADILGHEGEGSLLQYLKADGLAEGLSAGSGLSYNGGGLFVIDISLTKKGEKHWQDVALAVYQAVNRLKKTGVTEAQYEEQKRLLDIRFRFQEKTDPISTVSGLASAMHHYAPRDVLRGGYLLDQFAPERTADLLSYIRPDNALVTLSGLDVTTDKTTQLYNVDYSFAPVSEKLLKHWQQAGINPRIVEPKANRFIADNFDLINPKSAQKTPELIAPKAAKYRLWFGVDQQFRLPKGLLKANFNSAEVQHSPEAAVKLMLLAAISQDALNSFSYPAMLAGLQFNISANSRGLGFTIQGYNDKQAVLLDQLLKSLTSPTYNQDRFDNIKNEFKRRWLNAALQPSYSRLIAEMRRSLMRTAWSNDELIAALDTMSLQQVLDYRGQFFSSVAMDMFVYGNYSRQQAIGYADKIASQLNVDSGDGGDLEVVKLQGNENWSLSVPVKQTDAAGLLYIQGHDDGYAERAMIGMTAQLLKAPFYSSLRTEQQLGYIVHSAPKVTVKMPGLLFLVQSPTASPSKIEQAMLDFLFNFSDTVALQGADAFNRQRQALVSEVNKAPENISDQASLYWRQINYGYHDFDMRAQLTKAIETVDMPSWMAFYRQRLGADIERSIWFKTPEKNAQTLLDAKPIKDIKAFKSEHSYYRYP